MSPIRQSRISKEAAEDNLRLYAEVWRRSKDSVVAAIQLEAALKMWAEACKEVGAAEAARPMDGVNDPLLALADNGAPSDEQIETLFIGKRG